MTPGVNAIGDFSAVHGLAEAARRVVEALVLAGVDVSIVDAESGAPRDDTRRGDVIDALPTGIRHPIDLVLLNVNEMPHLDLALDRYTIGLWYWELLDLDPIRRDQYDRVDELWAASDFVAYTLRAFGPKPVRVIPAVVPSVRPEPLDPDVLALPEGLRVLFTFDAKSSVARKNPFGCVEAFARAFGPDERGRTAHLVVKMTGGESYPGLVEHLEDAIEEVAGILVTSSLPRAQMDALLAECDVYLSLHRSEGFGLGMAEAMSLGRAVVGTGYGGNTSFMTPQTAALVGYRMRRIRPEDHDLQEPYLGVYPPGRWWAEPDIDQAATWLRLLADRPDYRAVLGRRAAAHVREIASPHAVGSAMATRLEALGANPTS